MFDKMVLVWILAIHFCEIKSSYYDCSQNEKRNILLSFIKAPFMSNFSRDDVMFYLYTRENPTEPIKLSPTKKFANLFTKGEFKIIIHGWIEHAGIEWYPSMIKAFLEKDDYNVIAVDWSRGTTINYISSTYNVVNAGKYVAMFITDLVKHGGVQLDHIHVVGFSLGSHIAGIAGKDVYKLFGRKIGRITGLDPARPFFELPASCDQTRLIESDADFVDVIHTDAGLFGFKKPLGNVDFYPNGGTAFQPGCQNISRLSDVFCSHKRSHAYFIESINSRPVMAQACDSWNSFQQGRCNRYKQVPFGYLVPRDIRGTFYFTTSQHSPYLSCQ